MKKSALWTCLGALALVLSASSPAAPAATTLEGFEVIGDYILQVDGKESSTAEILRSQKAGGAILIIDPVLGQAVLLLPRSLQVDTLAVEDLVKGDNGTLTIPDGANTQTRGQFELTNESVEFELEGKALSLRDRPPLLGLKASADVLAYSPEYQRGADDYRPSAPIVRRLRDFSEPVRVRVFFGTWCAYCKKSIPKLLRLAEELDGSQVRFEYYGLPRGFSNEPEAKAMKIGSVPTAIIFVGNQEVDRITGRDWRIPELFLTDVLADAKATD